jgi:hypothetical protein
MPLDASAASNLLLLTWNDDSIDQLLPEYFPELDVAVFKDETLAARMFVCTNSKTTKTQPKAECF